MVFVTVGNATQGFRRLLDAVDDLARRDFFEDRVFIQSGHNADFQALHCDATPFVSMDDFNQMMENASLIICHGGCTQLQAIRLGKVPVVMPRREKYGEHVNDHQMQLVEALAAERKIVPVHEPDDLVQAIIEARQRNKTPLISQASPMLSLVAQAIEELVGSHC